MAISPISLEESWRAIAVAAVGGRDDGGYSETRERQGVGRSSPIHLGPSSEMIDIVEVGRKGPRLVVVQGSLAAASPPCYDDDEASAARRRYRMPKILVVTSNPLMAFGGHLVIAEALVDALNARGFAAALWLTPQNRFGRQAGAYAATALADFTRAGDGSRIDQIISMRFPSYAASHERHVCWLNHPMREYYDLWPSFSASLSSRNRVKERVRRALMHAADRYCLTKKVGRVFAQSRLIADRLAAAPGVASEVPLSAASPARVQV